MTYPSSLGTLDASEQMKREWQKILNLLANLIDVPAALIMRLKEEDIEVYLSSETDKNPYSPGAKEHFLGSGLYCETAIKSNRALLVPDALSDPDWRDNPDVKLDMISYLGMPLVLPDQTPFGTICVLDNKPNSYNETAVSLLESFRSVLEGHLAIVYTNAMLGDQDRTLAGYLEEVRLLRGIAPICAFCKKIRDENGDWTDIEAYVSERSLVKFSHTFCPSCCEKHYGVSMPPK